jgi:hypothetical protein
MDEAEESLDVVFPSGDVTLHSNRQAFVRSEKLHSKDFRASSYSNRGQESRVAYAPAISY